MDIRVENLCKSYGNNQVLDQFSCVFKEKKTTCIMGKSGVGKTTLLSILLGMEKADSGTIDGLQGKKISAVFQENRLFENLDAVTNIRITTGKTKEEIIPLLKKMDLPEADEKPVREYSGGMKRRAAIARALLADYDLLLMDEPLKGLDEATKNKVAEVIKRKTFDKTVIFVTHEKSECEFFGAECIHI